MSTNYLVSPEEKAILIKPIKGDLNILRPNNEGRRWWPYPPSLALLDKLGVCGCSLAGLARLFKAPGQSSERRALHIAHTVGTPEALLRSLHVTQLLVHIAQCHDHPWVRRTEVLSTSAREKRNSFSASYPPQGKKKLQSKLSGTIDKLIFFHHSYDCQITWMKFWPD